MHPHSESGEDIMKADRLLDREKERSMEEDSMLDDQHRS